jgi:hypothetical protein
MANPAFIACQALTLYIGNSQEWKRIRSTLPDLKLPIRVEMEQNRLQAGVPEYLPRART